jgi:hypothetical protein
MISTPHSGLSLVLDPGSLSANSGSWFRRGRDWLAMRIPRRVLYYQGFQARQRAPVLGALVIEAGDKT